MAVMWWGEEYREKEREERGCVGGWVSESGRRELRRSMRRRQKWRKEKKPYRTYLMEGAAGDSS
jgi:hypothetical protein